METNLALPALLSELERANLLRDIVSLLYLCNSNIAAFGVAGSNRRRSIQKLFAKVKNLPIEEYASLLFKHRVDQSDNTKNELAIMSRTPTRRLLPQMRSSASISSADSQSGSDHSPSVLRTPSQNDPPLHQPVTSPPAAADGRLLTRLRGMALKK
eukprot:scaffold63885_cov54-Attheya_sp.AAC.1